MFGIGETELVIIVVFAFLLFGPDKLPGMGRTLGRVLRQFREASDGFTEVVQANIMDPASEELQKSPKQRKREAALADSDGDARVEGASASDAATPEEPKRRETFAERKARLMAEREAARSVDVKDQEAVFDDEQESAAGADSDDDLEEEPRRASAQDLYAMAGAHSSRFAQATDETQGEGEGSVEA